MRGLAGRKGSTGRLLHVAAMYSTRLRPVWPALNRILPKHPTWYGVTKDEFLRSLAKRALTKSTFSVLSTARARN